ncbi:hypothetical protein L3X38_033976 [Prunus dulcis]|uniref:Uncharacterized protein n=1 Tax=Prunus dulcis TaxID=3755 RepID=A0AAD4VH89_PRUDU|nr:hypothetical protein L3X38_033976 [Prunus dulcis]
MSGPTGGRNSKAPTPEHPTPCVASKLCPTRADWIITHRNIQRHGDDPKLYDKSFHMPEHPTPHMESVSHAGTSNAATSPDSPTRRRTRWQRVGVQSNFWLRKNSTPEVTLPTLASTRGQEHFLQLRGGPIPAATGRNFSLKFGPNPKFLNRFLRQRIDPNLPQEQLELVKRMRNHTSITGFGRRRRRRDGGTVPVRTSRARGRSSWFLTGKTGRA